MWPDGPEDPGPLPKVVYDSEAPCNQQKVVREDTSHQPKVVYESDNGDRQVFSIRGIDVVFDDNDESVWGPWGHP